jgi:hypothetical protein
VGNAGPSLESRGLTCCAGAWARRDAPKRRWGRHLFPLCIRHGQVAVLRVGRLRVQPPLAGSCACGAPANCRAQSAIPFRGSQTGVASQPRHPRWGHSGQFSAGDPAIGVGVGVGRPIASVRPSIVDWMQSLQSLQSWHCGTYGPRKLVPVTTAGEQHSANVSAQRKSVECGDTHAQSSSRQKSLPSAVKKITRQLFRGDRNLRSLLQPARLGEKTFNGFFCLWRPTSSINQKLPRLIW